MYLYIYIHKCLDKMLVLCSFFFFLVFQSRNVKGRFETQQLS